MHRKEVKTIYVVGHYPNMELSVILDSLVPVVDTDLLQLTVLQIVLPNSLRQ